MKVKNYKDLDVWNKGIDIVDSIYDLTENYPAKEQYGLVVQMRKAAVNIPSNIAEGFIRQHNKEFVQFLYVSLGSAAELETQLIISYRRKFIQESNLIDLQEALDHESRMLMNFIKSLKQK